ncbi:Prenyltransferase and squalene oxidase repeat-containing protein [Actinacidiphila rubida]|uniref:Prenyltransferase and squalene oxidase repeat-containing protein n=1 Tax=Actinacidiphila rubida TaxID=310780 RepID=A0A1H8FDC9_9ACTN|nr:prenyltransferase/squalene oxidase repeat-containing protein [Actinacidiphila rubida]SEN29921.1 Prenyltransferase and squalene oxidase repeat-containing protein [Actinacidiphila rubida]
MPLRRRAATVLAAATALTALTAPAALAAAPPAGLYGSGDPTYDGVWRQSYALLALHTEGVTPGAAAVSWLTGQQCADGGFPSFRASTTTPCAPKAEDTNATGIAVQALAALGGHQAEVGKATAWLKTVQNADGGWSYNPGAASDPDSTAVVLGAFAATGTAPESVRAGSGRTPYDALRGFQSGCAGKPADRGAFTYPMNGKKAVNAKATTDAVRASQGAGFVVAPQAADSASTAPGCTGSADPYASLAPKASGLAGAAWLAGQLSAGGQHLTAVTPGADKPTPDYGTTADAVVALAAGGQQTAAKAAYAWLAANAGAWAHGNPAALAQLVLAAHATGGDPRHAGGADLVTQLTNLGPAPAAASASATPSPSASPEHKKKDGGSGSVGTWLIVAVIFVASVGFGILLSTRKRRQV